MRINWKPADDLNQDTCSQESELPRPFPGVHGSPCSEAWRLRKFCWEQKKNAEKGGMVLILSLKIGSELHTRAHQNASGRVRTPQSIYTQPQLLSFPLRAPDPTAVLSCWPSRPDLSFLSKPPFNPALPSLLP